MNKEELERRVKLGSEFLTKGRQHYIDELDIKLTDNQWQAMLDNQEKLEAELARFD